MKTELIYELAPLVQFNPKEEGDNPHVEIDMTKVHHVFKRHVSEQGYGKKFTDVSKETLYKTVKFVPMANWWLYIGDDFTLDQILETVVEGKKENKMYKYLVGDDSKAYVYRCRDIQQVVHDTFESGEYLIGKKTIADYDLEVAVPKETTEKINGLLDGVKLPPMQVMMRSLRTHKETLQDFIDTNNNLEGNLSTAQADIEELKKQIGDYVLKSELAASGPITIEHDGTVPEGKMVTKKASELWPDMTLASDFDLPYFEWDGVHPDVPAIDPHYIFRETELVRVLFSVVTNQRCYLHGHTGSGKTTLIEQVAARLNYPFVRVNFDSNITRFDLMGRDVLTVDEGGNTVSKFVDGILPGAMSSPCIFCADEIDFCQPDVSYVMQAATEGNSLRIPEDGDRIVQPHQQFRMFATGNTVGQGDEHGMYQGARPQSLAFLDRFTVWCNVGYMDKVQRETLIKRHYPSLATDDMTTLSHYIDEHIEAFTSNKVLQPITPRGMLAIAKATVILGSLKEALSMSVLDKASSDDKATLRGLIDRVTN